MNRCIAVCHAKRFDFEALKSHLLETHRATFYRDAIHLEEEGDIYVFPYGVMVFWGLELDTEKRLIEEVGPYAIEPLEHPVSDTFQYTLDSEQNRIHEDFIYLTEDQVLNKLAVSHGIAQSVKLSELETYAETTIEQTAHIPRNMAKTGSSQLSRRDIARMRGQLFLVESDIHLHYALLDTPEFFWEFPEVEHLYSLATRYLEVEPRIEVLNRKLQIIHEMFGMLADEQKHKHSSLLEWIIIWLIAIEIVLFFVH